MTTGAKRKILLNSVHCHTCNSILISESHKTREYCLCVDDVFVSIGGGSMFLSLDAGPNAQYSILHEFGELVD